MLRVPYQTHSADQGPCGHWTPSSDGTRTFTQSAPWAPSPTPPICFAFTRRRRVHQGQGAHRSGNRPWILSWLRSQLHPIVAWTTSPLFSPADLAGDHQQSTSQTVVEEKNKSFYFGMSLQRSLTNQQTRGIAFSPLLISLLEGAQAWRVLTQLSLFNHSLLPPWASLVAPMVKNLPAIQETRV